MTNLRLTRPFTPTEQRIGQGIVANLTYAEIASELRSSNGDGSIRPRTVRAYVETMHQKIIGLEDMPPRWGVFVYFKFELWKDEHISPERTRLTHRLS